MGDPGGCEHAPAGTNPSRGCFGITILIQAGVGTCTAASSCRLWTAGQRRRPGKSHHERSSRLAFPQAKAASLSGSLRLPASLRSVHPAAAAAAAAQRGLLGKGFGTFLKAQYRAVLLGRVRGSEEGWVALAPTTTTSTEKKYQYARPVPRFWSARSWHRGWRGAEPAILSNRLRGASTWE